MKRFPIAALAALAGLSGPALADGAPHGPAGGRPADHATHMTAPAAAGAPTEQGRPREPGQAAFAAIAEIVAMLEADPATDWSKVDIEALRRHLADMDRVTLDAVPTAEPVPGGARFTVRGEGETRAAIRRMVNAHAATMDGVGGWSFAAADTAEGAVLTAMAGDPAEVAKLRALGFIGVMSRGRHHQEHHLAIASGAAPHE